MAMPLDVSLWSLIDDRIEQLMVQWSTTRTDLASSNIVVAEQFDPQPDLLPMILVRSYEVSFEEAQPEFGDGLYHMSEIVYPYEIVVVSNKDTPQQAKSFAVNVVSEVRNVLRNDMNNLLSLQSLDGEKVLRYEFDSAEVFVRGLAGAYREGEYMATCGVTFRFVTEV